jgi:uncharacterized membrane protein YecN with MAPEG domain
MARQKAKKGRARMAGLTRTQIGVAAGMAGGLALTVAAFLWPSLPDIAADDQYTWQTSWLACSALTAFWLLVAIARLAAHRFFTPEDIQGGGLSEGTAKARLLQSMIQNTLEQVVLAVVAYGAWLWLMPGPRAGLVILCAIMFSIGRLLFFAGYARGAPWRALGFTLTFYPTVGLYLFLMPAVAARLFP